MNITTRQYLFIAYLCYACFLIGLVFAPVAGAAITYIKRAECAHDEVLASHNEYLIRTFWLSVAANVVGWASVLVLVGWAVLFVWALWLVFRVVKGLVALNDSLAIDAKSWF